MYAAAMQRPLYSLPGPWNHFTTCAMNYQFQFQRSSKLIVFTLWIQSISLVKIAIGWSVTDRNQLISEFSGNEMKLQCPQQLCYAQFPEFSEKEHFSQKLSTVMDHWCKHREEWLNFSSPLNTGFGTISGVVFQPFLDQNGIVWCLLQSSCMTLVWWVCSTKSVVDDLLEGRHVWNTFHYIMEYSM